MKDYNEMARRVLERRDWYETEQKQRHQRMRRRVTTGVCAFVAVFVGLSAWLAVDTEARAYVQEVKKLWKKTFDGEWHRYTFIVSRPYTVAPECELTWVPEGYEYVPGATLKDHLSEKERRYFIYKNQETNESITFAVYTNQGVPGVSFSDDYEFEEVSVNGEPAEFFYISRDNPFFGGLMWADGTRNLHFEIFGGYAHNGLTIEDYIAMAESMAIVE